MEKLTPISKHRMLLFSLALMAIFFASCESDFDVDEIDTSGTEPPVIHSVNEGREDLPVNQGVLENTYIIRGENFSTLTAIYFNGVRAGFNPALTTDELTFTSVPENTPYLGQENILRMENMAGATEYDFSILTIEEFTEATTEDGIKTVTLLGGDFSDTDKVTFSSGTEEAGNLVEREAEILLVSEAELTVAVPSGVEQAYIYVHTSRGATAQSDSYGFSYSIYIDELSPEWATSEWGGTHDLYSTQQALGQYSIKSIRDAWAGLTFTPETPVAFDEYSAITVSLYGTVSDQKVNLAINDFLGTVELNLVEGQWNKVVIPLSDFFPSGGAPAVINRIDFQEASNTGAAQYIFFVDDFGFL